MYSRAAASKDYADTWLYLCLPLICAVRNTDLVRLPHPRLVSTPQATLEQIKTGRFDNDARIVLGTIMDKLGITMPDPNKTKGVSGVGSIKIIIPSSLEVHFGTLWAAAEAHFRLSELPVGAPLIRVITTYEQINRYMGTDIGSLFLRRDYSARAANKAYMQSIEMIAEQTNGASDALRVSGYMLAALARSHKGSYGNFAATTYRYLRDAKLSGLTPEFVGRELFERGVMSWVPSMLLKMIAGKDYHRLSAGQQTAVTKSLDLSPLEVEQSVAVMQANAKAAQEIAVELYNNHTPEQVLQILQRIGNGQAVAKCDYCMCLCTAMGQLCPYPGRNCITCPYEVTTRATLSYLASEVKRLQGQYKSAGNPVDRARYKELATSVVLPAISTILGTIAQEYGVEAARDYEAIIKEVTHG